MGSGGGGNPRTRAPVAVPPATTVQEQLNRVGRTEDIERIATDVLEGELAGRLYDPGATLGHVRAKNGLLRWALSDRFDARLQWEALCRRGEITSREAYVERLWRSIAPDAANRDLYNLLGLWGVREAYRRVLFGWFLRRFDLSRAFGIFAREDTPEGALGRRLRGLAVTVVLLVVAGFVAVDRLGAVGLQGGAAVTLALAVLVSLGGGLWLLGPVPPGHLLEATAPRLAAGVGIGYLFLAAAPDLVRLLAAWQKPAALQLLVALGGLAAVWGYVTLHVHRRVHPPPRGRELAGRALDVMLLGLAWSGLGLALAAPLLFSGDFLTPQDPPWGPGSSPPAHTLLLAASIALALGVVL